MRAEELLLRAQQAEWAVWAPAVVRLSTWAWDARRRAREAGRRRALEAAALAFDEARWCAARRDPREDLRHQVGAAGRW